IKRPSNAFILYRKVYQKQVKEYYNIRDHCTVSQVCGASWGLEPEYIRRMYMDWADVESANHAKTWPGYKFSKKPRV
ncbi:high mobility group box domain-containing protein, partial [Diaporthe sp. PMI_573]